MKDESGKTKVGTGSLLSLFLFHLQSRALLFFVYLARFFRQGATDIARARASALFPVRVPIRTVRAARAIRLAAADGLVAKRDRAEGLLRVDCWSRHARAALLDDTMQPRVDLAQLLDFFFAELGQRAGAGFL